MLRARSPLGVFRGRPPFDRQPARLSDRGPPQPAPELCGSRRCLQGLGLSVVGGATPGRDTGKRSEVVAKTLMFGHVFVRMRCLTDDLSSDTLSTSCTHSRHPRESFGLRRRDAQAVAVLAGVVHSMVCIC